MIGLSLQFDITIKVMINVLVTQLRYFQCQQSVNMILYKTGEASPVQLRPSMLSRSWLKKGLRGWCGEWRIIFWRKL